MKKDVKDIIQTEETHLNNLLEPSDLSAFKGMVDELRDTWTKKQMFRTETEARFSVLQDNRYPTKAAKYWQCVREQSSYLDNLMSLSFDYRRNDAKITWLKNKIDKEEDEYKKIKYQIDLDECRFGKASMEKTARQQLSGNRGSSTSAIAVGGLPPPASSTTATEEWNVPVGIENITTS